MLDSGIRLNDEQLARLQAFAGMTGTARVMPAEAGIQRARNADLRIPLLITKL